MKLSKKIMVAAAVGALGVAAATPAMAFENEFHGMYRAYGIVSNAVSGGGGFQLKEKSGVNSYIEQRARLQYIAKASDDLKLVTHFELDSKFGGSSGGKYVTNDAGQLDADQVTLETKNVYLDFKIPSVPVRAMVGMQPFNDAFGGLYGNFDATGAVFTGTFGPVKATYGYFAVSNSNLTNATTSGVAFPSNDNVQDLNVLDLKYAINKNLTVGANYYALLDKGGANAKTLVNNTVGLNAAGKFGPATVGAVFGLQFGKEKGNANGQTAPIAISSNGTTAFAAAVNAKVAVGPGAVNAAVLYLSGDKNATGYNRAWQSIGSGVNYYTPANMWLITRNAATINTSTAIGATADLTRNGLGLLGFFAGYEGTAGKAFYNANIGYAKVDQKRTADSASIGTEINATIGYKLYANLSTQFTAAYMIIGDGYGKDSANLLTNGVRKADNPFLTQVALNYSF